MQMSVHTPMGLFDRAILACSLPISNDGSKCDVCKLQVRNFDFAKLTKIRVES